jgi:hypothetical protein
MKAVSMAAALQGLREQPLWRLLAADKAPAYIALLQSLLLDRETVLPTSILHERLTAALEELRAHGHDLPQTPQAYVSDWLREGWLTRRLAAGASEEVFELTAEAANALRFIASILKPRAAATESRLAAVIQQLARLAEETDPNPRTRIEALLAERSRIEREIEGVDRGFSKTISPERAVERAREIIALADELGGDFRNVRDAFDKLNRDLRQSLMENEGRRGDVLEALFAGVDLIGESEAGRSFNALWRLLTDSEQSATLGEAIDAVVDRPFARRLEARERRFLKDLTGMLVDQGGSVHDVMQSLARSLKSFVQSREFLEQRRLHALLKDAQHAALASRDLVRPNQQIGFSLTLTSSRLRSVSQWTLFDPSFEISNTDMPDAAVGDLSLDDIRRLVNESEIDLRSLRAHVRAILADQSQASIREILEKFPAEQGLGSIVGYVALGAKHGEVTEDSQVVTWNGQDGVARRARLPAIYFLRERVHELDG